MLGASYFKGGFKECEGLKLYGGHIKVNTVP